MDPCRVEPELTAQQAEGFVTRVKGHVASDPFRRGEEYWARALGLRGEALFHVLAKYRKEVD